MDLADGHIAALRKLSDSSIGKSGVLFRVSKLQISLPFLNFIFSIYYSCIVSNCQLCDTDTRNLMSKTKCSEEVINL